MIMIRPMIMMTLSYVDSISGGIPPSSLYVPHFYRAMLCIAPSMLSQDVCLSVRLSVCLSHATIASKRLNIISSNLLTVG